MPFHSLSRQLNISLRLYLSQSLSTKFLSLFSYLFLPHFHSPPPHITLSYFSLSLTFSLSLLPLSFPYLTHSFPHSLLPLLFLCLLSSSLTLLPFTILPLPLFLLLLSAPLSVSRSSPHCCTPMHHNALHCTVLYCTEFLCSAQCTQWNLLFRIQHLRESEQHPECYIWLSKCWISTETCVCIRGSAQGHALCCAMFCCPLYDMSKRCCCNALCCAVLLCSL